jgi:hypothetical protein
VGRKFIIAVLCLVFVLSLPVLLRKRTVPLLSNGKVVAFATRPFAMPWADNEFSVYSGKTKLFSLWGSFLEGSPLFIFPFADGERFLCINDDDTSVLVFVVDVSGRAPNALDSSAWPSDGYLRNYMAQRSTNVVIASNCAVRLPTYSEVQEVYSNMDRMTPRQLSAVSFPRADLGVYRFYWPKGILLAEIATNRTSVWPTNAMR